jgi:predicted CoA-binding protein
VAHDHVVEPRRHRLLAAAAAFVAVGAYGGVVGLMTGGLSLGARLNARLPIGSPVLGGFALLVWIAVPYTVLMVRAWRGARSTGATAEVVGAATVAWIVVQLAFIREVSFFHPLYGAIGVAFMVAGRRLRLAVEPEVDSSAARRFLEQRRIVLIGASADPAKFGNTVFRALVAHGYDVVPVNPAHTQIEGVECVASLRGVIGEVEAAMVMLTGAAALDAVEACVARRARRVWLFRGIGSPGALSPEAVAMCRHNGVEVVAGACPLMFLGPVEGAHRAHLAVRHFTRNVSSP